VDWSVTAKLCSRPTGKVCDCCGLKDNQPDPAEPSKRILWARHLRDEAGGAATVQVVMDDDDDDDAEHEDALKTDGTTCWCCFRVWNAVYMSMMKLSAYKKALMAHGSAGDELREDLKKYTAWLVSKVILAIEQTGSRDSTVKFHWPSPAQLLHLDIFQTEWVAPVNPCLALADYNFKFGALEMNGRLGVDLSMWKPLMS
jgi:hypothetical protein